MAAPRCGRRVSFGLIAAALVFGPLAIAVGAQEDEPPPADPADVIDAIVFYTNELFEADFDGDGVPDITDSDGDGIPDVPEGEPGERDIQPGNPAFLEEITDEWREQGFDTIVEADDGSTLLGHCGGMAMSFDADGKLIDLAVGVPSEEGGGPNGQLIDGFGDDFGKRAFTTDNPFEVDDRVIYIGTLPRSGEGPIEHNWSIKTAGISVDSGGDPNPNGKNRNAGEVDVGSVPSALQPAGIFPIKGELTSENGLYCEAEGWVIFTGGNPLFTAASGVAALFGGAGIIGLLFNSRPAVTWKA